MKILFKHLKINKCAKFSWNNPLVAKWNLLFLQIFFIGQRLMSSNIKSYEGSA